MKLSATAWERSLPVIHAIKKHPFNLELGSGSLCRNRFAYYIEQDTKYLDHFSKCHAILAARAPATHKHTFFHYADEEFMEEQAQVHAFYQQHFNLRQTNKTTPATIGYTNYLLRTVSREPFEIAVAAVLPCFWIYKEVGLSIAQVSKSDNPYARWIENYSRPTFGNSTNEMISVFDEISAFTTEDAHAKMLTAFHTSTKWEWRFWNDAYQQTVVNHRQRNICDINSALDSRNEERSLVPTSKQEIGLSHRFAIRAQ